MQSCTGQQGIDDARQTQTWVAQQLQIPSEHVAVASTGVIGEYLPMDKIKMDPNILRMLILQRQVRLTRQF
ncbi:bifunctional ornithine acetyltransferase/N-acetylglutamate synthase [Staphylococcus aureus]